MLVGRLTTIVSKLVPDVFKLTFPFTSKLLIVSCLAANSSVVANPVVEITPFVISIFVPAVKSQDISSPSMVIFAS